MKSEVGSARAPADDARWPLRELKELVDDRGITYGVVQPGKPRPKGTPIIRVSNVTRNGLQLDDVITIDPAIAAKYGRSRLVGGEVLITLVGSVGQVAVVPPQLAGWNVARAVGVVPLRPEVPERWVAWCLCSSEAQRYLEVRLNTTVQHTLNLRDLADLKIPMPPAATIAAITSVLGALDDKIENNYRIATRVEQIAATLFRAWFVDFVGAENLEATGIGQIPRGWRAGSLMDIARFVNGKAFTKHANGRGRPILRIRELNGGVDAGTPCTDVEAGDDHVAHRDDILFAWSGSLAVYRWSGPESLINQHIFKVIPEAWPSWFVYQWIQEHMREFRAIARDKATTMGHIQRRHLSEAAVPIPGPDAIAQANDLLEPLDRQRAMLVAEAATLRELRDALLPRLVSGTIRVPDAADLDEVIEPASEVLTAATR